MLLATAVGFLGGSTAFTPVFNLPLFPFGMFFVFLYPLVMTYAIVRHQLLDIEVIIKKTLVFAGLLGMLMMIVALMTTLAQSYIGRHFHINSTFSMIICGLVVILLYERVKKWLVEITDRFLFQKKFDYRKILKAASEGLSHVNSLKHQLRLVTHFITSRARIKAAAIYMSENGEHDFSLKSFYRFRITTHFELKIAFDSQILMYLKNEREHPYLEHYEIEEEARRFRASSRTYRYKIGGMQEEMQRLGAHLIIPSFYQDELQGILVLGEKRSEEPYNEEDINLFQTIAQESAIAFENSRKHDELVAQREKLEGTNEELRRTQAEVIQAKEEAAVSQLSGGIAHEVKNAIYGLYTGTEMVEDALRRVVSSLKNWHLAGGHDKELNRTDLFSDVEESIMGLKQVRQASQHIDDVAHTLSQLTKGKHAEMGRNGVRTLLKGMVSFGVLRTYGDRARTQALDEPPQINAESMLPPVRAHVELMRAVFLNLFKNAIHAMDGISPKRIVINAKVDPVDKDMIRIEFSDNGKGIPPDVLPKIFDYGFTTKGAQGEGKGLYNVKTIIEGEHRGKISVESTVGKGTTFIIKLPIWKEDNE